MATDWGLIRAMMENAIATCERLEALGVDDGCRDATVLVGDHTVSVFDVLTSAWVYPERLRYQIVRDRHAAGDDQPYVPEAARVLVNTAQACAELIAAHDTSRAAPACRAMIAWYRDHALPAIERARADRKPAP